MTSLDREGFNIIERQYREELAEAERLIREQLETEYDKKQYSGTPQMQASARQAMQLEMQQKIAQSVAEREQQISNFHFKEFGGRDAVLKQIERTEKEAAYEQRLQEHFNQKGQTRENDKEDYGR